MLTTQECILTHLLNCGTADLSELEDIKYDLDEILDDLIENNCLSFNNLLQAVFEKGISELEDAVKENKGVIKSDLEYLITLLPSQESTEEMVNKFENELSNDDYNLLQNYGNFEWKENAQECLSELNELDPKFDIDYYCNCLDSHIRFIQHEKTYRKLFKSKIEEIENNIGYEFY